MEWLFVGWELTGNPTITKHHAIQIDGINLMEGAAQSTINLIHQLKQKQINLFLFSFMNSINVLIEWVNENIL